jgi:prolyl-tRNA synthetase
MLADATVFRDANIHEARTFDQIKGIVTDGWAKAYWCGNPDCEARIKEETKATNRCIPLEQEDWGANVCVVCGEAAREWSYWARAY